MMTISKLIRRLIWPPQIQRVQGRSAAVTIEPYWGLCHPLTLIGPIPHMAAYQTDFSDYFMSVTNEIRNISSPPNVIVGTICIGVKENKETTLACQ